MPKNKSLKKVVYLLGAGATQAEIDFKGVDINVLMKPNYSKQDGVCARVMKKAKSFPSLKWLYELKQDGRHIDIEQVIGQIEETNLKQQNQMAEKLRELYCQDITDNLEKAGVLKDPTLIKALFEMHQNLTNHNEELLGIISLNHDNLAEIASIEILKGLNLGFEFKTPGAFINQKLDQKIIKLHGSFNWRISNPIRIEKEYKKDQSNRLWIPPTVFKELRNYPFNKLLGLSFELLSKCDVLRVIGCSLSQNDWRIISLIFNAQRTCWNYCFEIQLIMTDKSGVEIKRNLGYLKKFITFGELGPSFAHFSSRKDKKHYNSFEIFLRETIQDFLKSSGTDENNLQNIDNIKKIINKGRT